MKKVIAVVLALAFLVSMAVLTASGYYADEYGRKEPVAAVQEHETDGDAAYIMPDDTDMCEDKPVFEEVPLVVPKHEHRYEYIHEEGYAICLYCGHCINIPQVSCETDGDSTQP